MKKAFLAFVTVWVVGYLIFAFVTWEFNPESWGFSNRGLFVALATIISVNAAAFIFLKQK